MSYLLSVDKRSGAAAGITAELVCYVTADKAWALGSEKEHQIRPVYTAFLATDDEARALVGALRGGDHAANIRPASGSWDQHQIEWPKSAGYRWIAKPVGDGTVLVEVVLRELFDLDPGPPSGSEPMVQMLVATPARWANEPGRQTRRGALFAARLDRRTKMPLLADPEFHDYLLREVQRQQWCVKPCWTRTVRGELFALPEDRVKEVFADLFLVRATTETLETWIEHSTQAWAASGLRAVERRPLPVTFSVAAHEEPAYAPEPIDTSLIAMPAPAAPVEEAVADEPEEPPVPPPPLPARRRQMTFSFLDA